MKAVVYEKYGSPDELTLQELEKPIPREHEVLIKVHATAINEWDRGLLKGKPYVNRMINGFFKPKKFNILGCDIAGRIEAVGAKVQQFQVGDDVFGDLSSGNWGGFAEYVCASEKALSLKPSKMTFEQAASIPQAGLLALQGLRKGEIRQGQKVLINGASGGAGTFAIQIAKSFGAKVTGVCSTKKMEFVRSLGAEYVIDYTKEDFTKNGQQYDLILDVMGYHSIFDYKRALSPQGNYVMLGGANSIAMQSIFLGPLLSLLSSKKMGLLILKPNEGLDFMEELFEADKVDPVIDRSYPLNELPQAMWYCEKGEAKGKVVITM